MLVPKSQPYVFRPVGQIHPRPLEPDRKRTGYVYKLHNLLAGQAVEFGDRFLDVGCGNGDVVRHVAPRVSLAAGVDIDPQTVAAARANVAAFGSARIELADAARLPFPDRHFDAVTCYSTLVIVPDADAVLSEIARVLKPDGRAVLHFTGMAHPNPAYWRYWYKRHKAIRTNNYSLPAARRALRDHGFIEKACYATGITDMPGPQPRWWKAVFHGAREPDFDFVLSNLPGLRNFAPHYFFAVRRSGENCLKF